MMLIIQLSLLLYMFKFLNTVFIFFLMVAITIVEDDKCPCGILFVGGLGLWGCQLPLVPLMCLPCGLVSKESTCNVGDLGSISRGRAWQPTLVLLPGEFPRTEEPGGLQSTGLQRVIHDRVTKHSTRNVAYPFGALALKVDRLKLAGTALSHPLYGLGPSFSPCESWIPHL